MPASRHILAAAAHVLLAIALGAAALYVYMLNDRYLGSGDTAPAELMPISILREGNLDFNEFGSNLERGYMYDKVGDRVISFYPIVPGLLNVPAFWLADGDGVDLHAQRRELSKWSAATVAALSVSLMYLALWSACERWWTPLLLTSLYALGTAAWSVASNGMWQHGPSLLFLAGGMACLAARPTWLAALAGLWFGMAVWNRPTNGVFLAAAGMYLLLHRRHALPGFVLAALAPLALMTWYSLTHWGSVLAMGQGHRFGAGRHGPHATHFASPLVENLAGLLLSPARGLLVFSPMLVLSFAMLVYLAAHPRRGALALWMGVGALGHLIVHAKWSVWWGGWSFGYRLLIEMLPALTLLLALAWEQWVATRWWRLALFAPLAAASIYANYLGAWHYPSDFNAKPGNIDQHTHRLWDVRDTELVRLHRKHLKTWESAPSDRP
jgi:hypothetical protein